MKQRLPPFHDQSVEPARQNLEDDPSDGCQRGSRWMPFLQEVRTANAERALIMGPAPHIDRQPLRDDERSSQIETDDFDA